MQNNLPITTCKFCSEAAEDCICNRGLYHTDNTAEAAFMLLKGAVLHTLELNPEDGKVTIVLQQKNEGDLGKWILDWPSSREFKYYASFNLLTIKIKRLLNGNYKKATS